MKMYTQSEKKHGAEGIGQIFKYKGVTSDVTFYNEGVPCI
jgi:hypothetical protein